MQNDIKPFKSFAEFYPFYLREHSNQICRTLHYIGSLLVIATAVTSIVKGYWLGLIFCPVIGYGFAWIGHFFFEHNRPATFKYPVWSFLGDWVMLAHFLSGRLSDEHFKDGPNHKRGPAKP